MISTVQVTDEAVSPQSGGAAMSHAREKLEPKFVPIGVIYAKVEGAVVSFEIFYESHVEKAVKEEIAERFGIGAHEWRVTGR